MDADVAWTVRVEAWLVPAEVLLAGAVAGVMWVVQLAVYPQFVRVPMEAFGEYHRAHCRALAWVAGPLLTVEAVVAIVGLLFRRDFPTFVAAACLGIGWFVTFACHVPVHHRLSERRSPERALVRTLVNWHWVRTIAWSARCVVVLAAAASG